MTATVNFDDLLHKGLDELPKPMALPRGHYMLALRATFTRPPREEGKSGQIVFFYEPVSAMDDVDEAELELFLEGGRSIKDNNVSVEFWLGNRKDVEALHNHIGLHGVDVDPKVGVATLAKQAVNKRVVAYVSTETYMHKVKGMQSKDKAEGFTAVQ